jgi:hypothetical protein
VGVLSCGEDRNVCTRVWLEKVAWARGTNGGRPTKAKAGLGRREAACWGELRWQPGGEMVVGQPGKMG